MNSFGIALASILMVLLNIAIGWAIGARHGRKRLCAAARPQVQDADGMQVSESDDRELFPPDAETASTARGELVVRSPIKRNSAGSESAST
jgi:hypothetical protein